MFEALGVSSVEEAAYRLLLERPELSQKEIGEALRLPPGTVRRGLESLQLLGLLTKSPGRGTRFLPAPPDLAIDALIAKRLAEIGQVRSATQGLLELYARKGGQRRKAESLVEIIEGRESFGQHYLQLARSTSQELRSFDIPPYITPPGPCDATTVECLARGVVFRSLYDREALEVPGKLDSILEGMALGEKTRTTAGLPIKLAIADDRLALIAHVAPQQGLEKGFLIHPSPLLDALMAYFEVLWKRAFPIPVHEREAPGQPEVALSDQDRRLVAFLVGGLEPAAIARQLGLGASTVQRSINRLMKTLGVKTRLQLGFQLAELMRSETSRPDDGGGSFALTDQPKPEQRSGVGLESDEEGASLSRLA